MINPELLKILACPSCHQSLDYKKTSNQLVCKKCQQIYLMDDGIIQLIEPQEQLVQSEESKKG